MTKTCAVVALLGTLSAVSALAGGCGASSGRADGAPTDPTSMPTMDMSDLPPAPHLKNSTDAVADLFVGDCGTGPGAVTATGTVHNHGHRVQDYVVTVSWVTGKGAVVARGVAEAKDVAAGTTATWTAHTTLSDGGGYSCSASVSRGTL